MHTLPMAHRLTHRRLHVALAFLGGFLLLGIAGFAWATIDDDVDVRVTSSAATFVPGDTLTFTIATENVGPAYNANLEFRVNHGQSPKPVIISSTMPGGSIGTASNGNRS